jgi:cytochrome b6-f complex iron-sulfur subunit
MPPLDERHAASDPSRRSFLGRLLAGTLLGGAAAVVGAITAYLFTPNDVRSSLGPRRSKVAGANEIVPGEGKLVLVDDEPVWVVNLPTGFVALSALCTHQGCIVTWEAKRRLFHCPCHNGLFDERGNVVSGLPRRSLPRLRVAVVGDAVQVSGGEERS